MPSGTILLIEDENEIADLLTLYFEKEGFRPTDTPAIHHDLFQLTQVELQGTFAQRQEQLYRLLGVGQGAVILPGFCIW